MLSQTFIPRDSTHPENLNRTAAYIASEFTACGGEVHEQKFSMGDHEYKNVIASFGPESDEVIVVGAHYDAEGEKPGADDNASGVAGVLELARLLSQENLAQRILLVAFTLEEPPYFATEHMGSAVYAKSLAEEGIYVKLMVSVEMIGYFSDEPGSQTFPMPHLKLFYPSRGNYIAVVDQLWSSEGPRLKKAMNSVMDLKAYSINAPAAVPGVDFSDHRNFWSQGYPAVMITDTAFYRNTAYHTDEDTADRLDYQKMAEVADGLYYALLSNPL